MSLCVQLVAMREQLMSIGAQLMSIGVQLMLMGVQLVSLGVQLVRQKRDFGGTSCTPNGLGHPNRAVSAKLPRRNCHYGSNSWLTTGLERSDRRSTRGHRLWLAERTLRFSCKAITSWVPKGLERADSRRGSRPPCRSAGAPSESASRTQRESEGNDDDRWLYWRRIKKPVQRLT